MKSLLITAALFLGINSLIPAQSQFLMQDQFKQELNLSYGLQPNMALRATYTRQLPGRLPVALFASVETGFIQPVAENYALQLGANLLILKKGAFAVTNELAVKTGLLETEIYKSRKWEINEMLVAGWYGKRTGVALLAGYTQNLATHLTHSDFYRETIYADAKDGWYGGVGGYWQAGIRVTQRLGQRFDLSLQMAYDQSTKGYSVGPLPAFVQLGGGWRF